MILDLIETHFANFMDKTDPKLHDNATYLAQKYRLHSLQKRLILCMSYTWVLVLTCKYFGVLNYFVLVEMK